MMESMVQNRMELQHKINNGTFQNKKLEKQEEEECWPPCPLE